MQKKPISAASAILVWLCVFTALAAAGESPRKAFGKGNPFKVGELPAGKLKTHLLTLNPQARENAMTWLHTFAFNDSDAAEHLRVDHGGGIYIVCPDARGNCEGRQNQAAQTEAINDSSGTTGSVAPSPAPPVANAAVSVSSPPIYSSKPGATRHIYLDFNGGTVTGTAWNNNSSYGNVASWDVKVWSQDADRTTFNDAEQTWMRRVWQRVAEDYAPFDVDVTTNVAYDPGNYAGNKDLVGWVLICESTDNNNVALPHNGSGGVAYVGVFGDATYSPTYQPAWVTSTNGGGDESVIAEAASHEMGHNMGLSHDATSTLAYYGGHAATTTAPSWGPIMGTGYFRDVSQWSKGEYTDANQLQDDLSIISARTPYRPDDHGDNFAGATACTLSNNTISQSGIVETTSDPDVFSFTTGAGGISFTATPFRCDADTWGGNLDIILELYDSSQTLIGSSNPAADTTASISTTVATAGTYYLVLKPAAAGTPQVTSPSGYTVYGSLGQYTIAGTVQQFDPPLAVTGISPSSGNAGSTVTVDISGTKLAANTAIKLRKAGRADIVGTSVQLIGSTVRCQLDLTGVGSGQWDVVATNPDLTTSSLTGAFTVNGTLAAIWNENFDASAGPPANWVSQATTGSGTWSLLSDSSKSQSGTNLYSAPVPTGKTTSRLTSAPIAIPMDSTAAQLRFWHSYNLESQKDGGRIQLSLNNGTTWFNVEDPTSGASFAGNGYNATMFSGGNPATRSEFDGLAAWTGNSNGYVQTIINLNDANKYAGAVLRARWSIGTNSTAASTSWYVDSVSLFSDSAPVNQAPVVTVAASTASSEFQTVGPSIYQIIRGTGTNVSVTATDDAGEPALTYTWQSTGPAPVVFPVNGNNAAKNADVTFSAIGDYVLSVTAIDAAALSTVSSVNVRVLSTDSFAVTPSSGSLTIGSPLQFSAMARDQFGMPLASQPSPVNWSTSGGGSINSSGLFTATTAGGPFIITAASGAYSATAQVTVTPLAATVTLGNLNQTYNGSGRAISVITQPPGLAHSVNYNGSPIAPTNAGNYTAVATITDPNYSGSAAGSLVIAKASQTINFTALGEIPDNMVPFALTATATSGLSVSYGSSNSAVATISGSTVTLVGLGNTTITVSQAGDANFNAAASVQQTLTVVDGTAPNLTSIADDKGGGPVIVNTQVTYTVSFSEDMNAASVTAADFDNAGTSSITISTVTETLPGIFTVQATPTSPGTLQLRIHAGANLTDVVGNPLVTTSPLTDDTVITVISPYASWAGGAAFDVDTNGDGVDNGTAWLLGAATPSAELTLPVVTQSGGDLRLTFHCLNNANRGGALLSVLHSSDLGLSDPWTSVPVPDSSGGPVKGVSFTVTTGSPANTVQATISASEAAAGQLFGRFKASQ